MNRFTQFVLFARQLRRKALYCLRAMPVTFACSVLLGLAIAATLLHVLTWYYTPDTHVTSNVVSVSIFSGIDDAHVGICFDIGTHELGLAI